MFLGPPPPRNGLPMPTSGVATGFRNPVPVSSPCVALTVGTNAEPLLKKSTAKFGKVGFVKFGWLNTLKKSARNCMFTCSPKCVFFTIDQSKFLNVGPMKALRPTLPKCCEPETHPPAPAFSVVSHRQGAAKLPRLMRLKLLVPLDAPVP